MILFVDLSRFVVILVLLKLSFIWISPLVLLIAKWCLLLMESIRLKN